MRSLYGDFGMNQQKVEESVEVGLLKGERACIVMCFLCGCRLQYVTKLRSKSISISGKIDIWYFMQWH
jgi:hypothetical protein